MNRLISVILPVYNCDQYIKECIDSILSQTYTKFELIIIDDKSTDKTVEIIKSYTDNRIKLTLKEKNTGLTDSLNYGIHIAQGDFIARMDGDDVCMPTRFEEQIKVLIENPEISICGSWAKIIGINEYMETPECNHQIFKKFIFHNALIHPSLMFRKKVFENHKYDRNFEPAEDFNLWTRLIFEFNFYNIQKPLLNYRKHDMNVSKQRAQIQKEKFLESLYNFYSTINEDKSEVDLKIFKNFYLNTSFTTADFLKIYELYNSLLNYKKINLKKEVKLLDKRAVRKLLEQKPLIETIKVFIKLNINDKLQFIKYYIKKVKFS